MRTQLKFTLAALTAAVMLSTTALAGTISITSDAASWANAIPVTAAALVTYQNSGTLTPTARWGGVTVPLADQSGYNFSAVAVPFNGTVTPPFSSSLFALGTFAHVNEPIPTGTSISSIDLLYTANISINGALAAVKNFNFTFNHNETPNDANPCANGGANGVGINVNGCADHVQTAFSGLSDTFVIGAEIYTLNILGFGYLDTTGNLVQTHDFWTQELGTSTATLYAKIVLDNKSGGDVPEPASLALMGLGLVALAGTRRRQSGAS